jgi:hypothetical protein
VGSRTDLDAVVRRKCPSPCRVSNPGRPAHRLVTVLTKLDDDYDVDERRSGDIAPRIR